MLIEKQIIEISETLEGGENLGGASGALVDREGFPRADIDITGTPCKPLWAVLCPWDMSLGSSMPRRWLGEEVLEGDWRVLGVRRVEGGERQRRLRCWRWPKRAGGRLAPRIRTCWRG